MEYKIIQECFKDYDLKEIIAELKKIEGYSEHNLNIAYLSIERADRIASREKIFFNSKDLKSELNKLNKDDTDFLEYIKGLGMGINKIATKLKRKKK